MSLAIIYNILPHYRLETFRYISNNIDSVDIYHGVNNFDKIEQSKPSNLTNIYIGKYLIWQKGVLQVMRSNQYDKILMTGEVTIISNWIVLIWSKLFSPEIKTYLHSHGIDSSDHYFLKMLRVIFYRLANKVLVYNLSQERYLGHKFNVNAEAIFNSLPKTITSISRPSVMTKELVYVGRIQESKNILWLISALSSTGYSLRLIGPVASDFKNQIVKHGVLYNVKILFQDAMYSDTELKIAVRFSCGAVFPGNCGLGGLHMLSHGIPILTHSSRRFQTPEFEMINDRRFSVFYKYNSVESLRNQLTTLENKRKNMNYDALKTFIGFYQPERFANRIISALNND